MIPAFIALDGRSVCTHAAVAAALGLGAAAKRPATLIRVTGPGDAPLGYPTTMPDTVEVVERAIHSRAAGGQVEDAIAVARQQGRAVVIDLPARCLADGFCRPPSSTLAVLPVGPTALDERLAAAALQGLACLTARGGHGEEEGSSNVGASERERHPMPAWLLGCGRSGGGPAAASFQAGMRDTLMSAGGGHTPAQGAPPAARVLPITLPCLSRAEALSLIAGRPVPSVLRSALLLAAALHAAAADPSASGIDPAHFAAHVGAGDRTVVTRDGRGAPERLRDLADALQAIRDGLGPTPEELAAAPLLDGWTMEPRMVRALIGRSYDHPDFPSGRVVTTSEVYATDGRTYARTYSRLYRLGMPAQEAAASTH